MSVTCAHLDGPATADSMEKTTKHLQKLLVSLDQMGPISQYTSNSIIEFLFVCHVCLRVQEEPQPVVDIMLIFSVKFRSPIKENIKAVLQWTCLWSDQQTSVYYKSTV